MLQVNVVVQYGTFSRVICSLVIWYARTVIDSVWCVWCVWLWLWGYLSTVRILNERLDRLLFISLFSFLFFPLLFSVLIAVEVDALYWQSRFTSTSAHKHTVYFGGGAVLRIFSVVVATYNGMIEYVHHTYKCRWASQIHPRLLYRLFTLCFFLFCFTLSNYWRKRDAKQLSVLFTF